MKIDNRILELQERLARKRMMNQQLASQINAATTAKQAQLRAIQAGMTANKNKNKPVSTVEPIQRNQQNYPAAADEMLEINKNSDQPPPHPGGSAEASKYQTLPFGTKFGPSGPGGGAAPGAVAGPGMTKSQKIEQLKQEKENNNVQFASDLPPPPPMTAGGAQRGQQPYPHVDHQGNFNNGSADPNRPVSSVAPVFNAAGPPRERPTELFPPPQNASTPQEISGKPKPALPPKPLNQQLPPPYIPPPDNNKKSVTSDESSLDASITVRSGHQNYQGNLSVSAHPEEGMRHKL